MDKTYIVNITNGQGQANILRDTYNVTANVEGYDNSTITPQSITYDGTQTTYNFTIAANGTLTLHVTEDGTSLGTPIEGATFVRTDSTGTETYGSTVTTDASGNAVFANVPYDATTDISVYYKQTSSDGDHTFDDTVKEVKLTLKTTTVEVINEGTSEITIKLTDANYENLPIASGTITLS
ncbi:MAG: hypothetical protein ACI4WW_01520 [Candidatus Coprovivens sp.]